MKVPRQQEKKMSRNGALQNLFVVNVFTVSRESSGAQIHFLHHLIHFKDSAMGNYIFRENLSVALEVMTLLR